MALNPDGAKEEQEVILSTKTNKSRYSPLYLKTHASEKHLGLQLDSKLSLNEHTNNKISNETDGIGLLRTLQPILPQRSLLIICKSFIRHHLANEHVICYQPSHKSFSNKIESVQYNGAQLMAGAIKGSSCVKLYQELGL